MKYKLEGAVNAQRGAALQAALWGRGDMEDEDVGGFETVRDSTVAHIDIEGSGALRTLKKAALQMLVKVYPWVHMASEGAFTQKHCFVGWSL